MIISVHMPRTAGSSFRAYLRRHPRIRLQVVHGTPILVPAVLRNGYAVLDRIRNAFKPFAGDVDCLHGHFLPYQYEAFASQADVKFITWLREPADRVRSHYDYCFQSNRTVGKSSFQRKVAREKWSFEAFITHRYMRNLYHKILWNFPLERFEFIGVVEKFDEDFKYFRKGYCGDERGRVRHANRATSAAIADEDRRIIERLNAKDYDIYRRALTLRQRRLERDGASSKAGGARCSER